MGGGGGVEVQGSVEGGGFKVQGSLSGFGLRLNQCQKVLLALPGTALYRV